MEYDNFVTHSIDMYMGKPKSGKTLIAASYPRPLLYVSIGNDGGGRVIMTKYRSDVEKGLIKVINLRNDPLMGSKIKKTSCEKLLELLAELRKPDADKFKTIVIDTFAALQDDYKVAMETNKGNKALSMQEWGEVAKMVLNAKDNMKRFSEERKVTFVWITHTSEQELTETSGLNKEIRIVPDLTIKTGIKCMKDASNIFYCCRKTCLNDKGEKEVKFLTYVGPHPLMDTGTRDMLLKTGEFVEDFNYDKWQALIKAGVLDETKVLTPEVDTVNETKDDETSDEQ
nr:MAG TPA: AAA domain protein [Caudoviricetes sp.]